MVGVTSKQKQAIRLVRSMLTARRNGKIQHEQAAYEKVYAFCEKNNLDLENVIDGATRWLKENSIAASMNGIV